MPAPEILERATVIKRYSAARQLVFTEGGRGVEMVMVYGRVVVRDRKITTIDEKALREEVAELMKSLARISTPSFRATRP